MVLSFLSKAVSVFMLAATLAALSGCGGHSTQTQTAQPAAGPVNGVDLPTRAAVLTTN